MAHEVLDRSETIKASSNRTLGLTFAAVFLIVGLYPLAFGGQVRVWSIVIAGGFSIVAVVLPDLLGPLNKVWTRFGLLLHKIVSPIVLGILFFALVTPIGILMRLLGKDLLRLRWDRGAPTYWVNREPPGPKSETLTNQF